MGGSVAAQCMHKEQTEVPVNLIPVSGPQRRFIKSKCNCWAIIKGSFVLICYLNFTSLIICHKKCDFVRFYLINATIKCMDNYPVQNTF